MERMRGFERHRLRVDRGFKNLYGRQALCKAGGLPLELQFAVTDRLYMNKHAFFMQLSATSQLSTLNLQNTSEASLP